MNIRRLYTMMTVFVLSAALSPPSYAAGTESVDDFSAYFRMIWGLCIVLGIILILFTILKKRFNVFQARSGNAIHVLEIKPIMPKKSLCLVEVKGKEYLLGIGNENITCLAHLTPEKPESFSDVLEQTRTEAP